MEFDKLDSAEPAESSASVKKRVDAARAIQNERFRGTGIPCNARITPDRLHTYCILSDSARALLKRAFETIACRPVHTTACSRWPRTIADLDGSVGSKPSMQRKRSNTVL